MDWEERRNRNYYMYGKKSCIIAFSGRSTRSMKEHNFAQTNKILMSNAARPSRAEQKVVGQPIHDVHEPLQLIKNFVCMMNHTELCFFFFHANACNHFRQKTLPKRSISNGLVAGSAHTEQL
jgi:hypothetical protein